MIDVASAPGSFTGSQTPQTRTGSPQPVPGAPQTAPPPKAAAGAPGSLPTSSGLPTPGTTSPVNMGPLSSIGTGGQAPGAPTSYAPPPTPNSQAPSSFTGAQGQPIAIGGSLGAIGQGGGALPAATGSASGGGNYVPPQQSPQAQAAPQAGASSVPAQQAAGTAPPTPGVNTSSIGPGNDLLSSQINLAPNAQTAQTMGNAQNLANNLQDPQLYQQVAQQAFNTFAQQSDPAYQASLREAQAAAAASGGLGSGSLATNLGSLANQRNLQLEGMQQTEQQNATANQFGAQLAQLQAEQGLGNTEFGQQQAETGQANQQQGFQSQEQEQAIQNAAQQAALQAQLQGQQFNENMGLANFAYGGNPAAAEQQQGEFMGAQGQQALTGAGQLAQTNALNNALNGAGVPGGGSAAGAYGGGVANPASYLASLGLGSGNPVSPTLVTPDNGMPYTSGGMPIDPATGQPLPDIGGGGFAPAAPPLPYIDPTTGVPSNYGEDMYSL